VNYYGAKELAESCRVVRGNTITIAEEIPEDKFGFRPAPDTRTIGQLLAHIAMAHELPYQIHGREHRSSLDGFDFMGLAQRLAGDEKTARTKKQILAMLAASGETWAAWVGGLSESFLAERVQFGGPTPGSKSRFEMILSVKEHEMHHRGQLMLVERMIGLVPHLTRAREARRATASAGTAPPAAVPR